MWPLVLTVTSLATGCASSQDVQVTPDSATVAKSSSPAGGAARNGVLNAYLKSMRDDLSRGKVGIINDVMQLNAEEAKTFWPIYEEYESELFELGDQRVAAIRQFANDIRDHRLDDSEASKLAEQYFDYESKRLELLKKYHGEIAKSLSPVRAAQFAQIEHRVGTVVDLMIASEIPLLSGPTR
jgi:hypothetical protein